MKKKDFKELTKEDKKQIEVKSSMGITNKDISNDLRIKIGAVRDVLSAPKKASGLGDTVESFTKATGIKSLVKKIFGDDCNCDQRKQKLNKIWRYNKVNWLNAEEYQWITEYSKRKSKSKLTRDDQWVIFRMFNRVFEAGLKDKDIWCSCSPKRYVDALNKLIAVYNEMSEVIDEKNNNNNDK